MGPHSKRMVSDALLAIADELRMQRVLGERNGALLERIGKKLGVHDAEITELDLRVYKLEPNGNGAPPNAAAE